MHSHSRRASESRTSDGGGVAQLLLPDCRHARCIVALPLLAKLRPPDAGVPPTAAGVPGWAAATHATIPGLSSQPCCRRGRSVHANACADKALRDGSVHRPRSPQRGLGHWEWTRLLPSTAGQQGTQLRLLRLLPGQRLQLPHGERAIAVACEHAVQLLRPAANVSKQNEAGKQAGKACSFGRRTLQVAKARERT